MKLRIIMTLAIISVWLFVFGCAKPTKMDNQALPHLSASNQQIVSTAETVLTDMHFVIEKADANGGYITTKPLAGQEWFEFWRSDATSSKSLAQSSLHSLQKTVEIAISKTDDGKSYIDCIVKVQKLSIPHKPISGFSDLPGIFSKSSTSRQRLDVRKNDKSEMMWIDLENDDKLAEKIKNKIIRKV